MIREDVGMGFGSGRHNLRRKFNKESPLVLRQSHRGGTEYLIL